MNKKIAISANTSWYIYNFRKNTILSLIDKGYTVYVVAPKDEYSEMLGKLGVLFYDIPIDSRGVNPYKDIITLRHYFNFFKKSKVDAVLNFTPKSNVYSTLAAKFFDVKVINNIAGLGTLFIKESLTSKIAKFLYKLSQRKADFIFFQNNDDLELFKKLDVLNDFNYDRLPGSGVDLSRFKLAPAPNDGVIKFLVVARLLTEKGIEVYADSARALKKKYGEKVDFGLLGFLDENNPSSISKGQIDGWEAEGIINYLGVSDEVETIIANVDCIVLPSYYREGVPKSLLEAAAMGKPIVTTDNVGCRETVADGVNGFLCTPRSVESLTNKLELIITMSHKQRLVFGLKSREKVEQEFDENLVINRYLECLENLLFSNTNNK